MIRVPAILFLTFVLSWEVTAQYANDWIVPGQQYVRIPVAKDALYKLPFSEISRAGLSVTAPERLQLFHRGIEQPIAVGADYVEFYGIRNDGFTDRELYANESFQPHGLYNLFSDTTSYFLTQGGSPGKRIEVYEESSTGLTPQTYVLREETLLLTQSYSTGKDYGEIIKTVFDEGEGWMGPVISQGQAITYDTLKEIINTVQSGGKPVLEMVITGRGPMQHGVEVYGGVSGRLITSFTIDGFASRTILQEIEWTDISPDGACKVGVKVNVVNTSSAHVSVNYLQLRFAHQPDLAGEDNFFFTLPPDSGNTLIELANVPAGARLFDITDRSLLKEISHSSGSAVVRPSSTERLLFITAAPIVPEAKLVSFRQINPLDFNYIIISHPRLRSSASGYSDPVQAYADYRASQPGGAYAPLVINIDELYEQFNYGEQSPLAIFHFMEYLASKRLPEYLFIIGKGLDVDYDYFRKPGPAIIYKSLVPTAGMPASDMAFTAGLDGVDYVPAVPTGRITAMEPGEVAAYLDKVKETEARPFDDLRRKNVLHLSGGIYQGETQDFRRYLEALAVKARTFYLGGKVDAIAKQSTDIKLINISREINAGLGLVTFFGHSSAATLDFDVGYVSDNVMGYDNKGRYPVLLMNGCQAGAFFRYAELFGEDWINTANKGAVGFIAHSSLGFVSLLRKYSGLFYDIGFGDSIFIRKGLGDIQKEVARRFLETSLYGPGDITQVQQMVLLGDPAVALFGAPDPDYSINDNQVSVSTLDEHPLTVASDSFAINFIVKNFGQAIDQPLKVQVLRVLPDRSTVTYDSSYAPILYADTLQFIVRGKADNGAGLNTFEIRVDAGNETEEIRENNNTAYIDFFLPENGTLNLYPTRFSIVSEQEVSLSFQHTDLHSGERQFLVEIDTAYDFSSAYKMSFTVSGTVLALKRVILLDHDTAAYYWRTRIADPLENESREWTASSFTFIKEGSSGFAQVQFPQFLENQKTGLVSDLIRREFHFEETVTGVNITTFGSAAGMPPGAVSVLIDSAEYNLVSQGFGCRENTINLIAFDKRSTVPYPGIFFQWFNRGGRACGREPWAINSFAYNEMLTGNNDDIIQYVDNIPTGDSVILFNIGNAFYELWPEEAKIKLGELGISVAQISELLPGEPVVIFGRKGIAPGEAVIIRAGGDAPASQTLEVEATVTGRFTSGEMKSVALGPAFRWDHIYFDILGEASDGASVSVIGLDVDGGEDLLLDSVATGTDLSAIDAETYPRIRLRYATSDETNLTPAELKNWIVTYEAVPEGLVFYSGGRETTILQEGVEWTGTYGFTNVSQAAFKQPLEVRYTVYNQPSFSSSQQSVIIDPPAPGDTTLFTITVDTFQKAGLNDVEVFVNPEVAPEQYYNNNVFLLRDLIDVKRESFNPLIDVTFDGRYIHNGEYVSEHPDIEIRLWDENSILLKEDTAGVQIFISYPCAEASCSFRRVNFSDDDVRWYPASATSDFRVLLSPQDLPDGQYTLRISASDKSGNSSGDRPFEISFVVQDEVSVSLSEPFPNPAGEELNLDLVISGQASPERVDITLTNLNGQIVGSNRIDVSQLHIGSNRISLATNTMPGIYIYRIIVRHQGVIYERKGKVFLVN